MTSLKKKAEKEWYKIKAEEIAQQFNSDLEKGLSNSKVKINKEKYGQNLLNDQKTKGFWEIFLKQFQSPLIYLLLIATLIVFLLGDFIDSIIIFSILLINSGIGAIQEGRAQNTFAALKRVVKSYATVVRNNEEQRIVDSELVPGDIILVKDGEAISADARLINSNSLKVDESSLTGESEIVLKNSELLNEVSLEDSEQKNMLFRGTYVISGIARAIVVRTGGETVIGKIANQLLKLDINIPLKKNIDNLSKVLVVSITGISFLIFLFGIMNGREVSEMFLTVVALAVSAIPEGLPIVVTVVLAAGVWRMGKKNVLIKRLQAVEVLGQARVIALDKTGTITKNQMSIEKIFVNSRYLDVTGNGYSPIGKFYENEKEIDFKKDADLDLVAKTSVFTAIAKIGSSRNEEDWFLEYGDPTEAALMVLGQKMGIEKSDLLRENPQILEIPFEIKTKYHLTINDVQGSNFLSIAGGPEVILDKCSKIWKDGEDKSLNKTDLARINESIRSFSNEGYRLIMLACDFSSRKKVNQNDLKNLTFVGLVAIADSIREEVFAAVEAVQKAGIKPVMITGDHKDTAVAIARKVGIFSDGDFVLTGREMREMSNEKIISNLAKVTVFARVSPEDKMRIIDLYKQSHQTIAMTGDGINDALSLTAAHLGVSMGKIGTEVAKEAADIILLDDNFGNIVDAAEEGRNIYLIIRKSILFLLATNLGEILVIIIAILANLPLPIIATQIIWLNLITEASLIIMLAFDPKEKNLLREKFVKPSKFIVDKEMLLRIILIAMVMAASSLYVFTKYLGEDMTKVWTMTLTVLTVMQWYNIFNIRSDKESVFSKKLFNNFYLLLGLFISIFLHLFAIYTPFMQDILKLTALSIKEWSLILFISLSIVLVEEIRKFFRRQNFLSFFKGRRV